MSASAALDQGVTALRCLLDVAQMRPINDEADEQKVAALIDQGVGCLLDAMNEVYQL